MRLSAVIVAVVLLSGAVAQSADRSPMPPRETVSVKTDIGSVATVSGKISVALTLEAGANAEAPLVTLRPQGSLFSGGLIRAPAESIAAVADKLEEALEALEAGKPFETTSGKVEIVVTELRGKPVIAIRGASERPLNMGDRTYLDLDNASLLVQILNRAARISAFLIPRVEKLLED